MGLLSDIGSGIGTAAGYYLGGIYGAAAGQSVGSGDAFSQDGMPDYRLSQLDANTAALKDAAMARASRPASEIAAETMQGTDKGGLLKSGLANQQESNRALGYNDEQAALGNAISAKAQKNYEQSLGDLGRRTQVQAPVERFQRMAGGAELQQKVAQMESALVDREVQNTLNRRAARNATIGNILGIAGTVVGGIFGGPAGAQAGGAVGGSMGGNKTQYTMGELDRSRGGR